MKTKRYKFSECVGWPGPHDTVAQLIRPAQKLKPVELRGDPIIVVAPSPLHPMAYRDIE